MRILRSYATSEEAHLAATFLRSSGIDAVVFDDSAYGGNVLGAAGRSSIRIEVPDQTYDEARKALDVFQEGRSEI